MTIYPGLRRRAIPNPAADYRLYEERYGDRLVLVIGVDPVAGWAFVLEDRDWADRFAIADDPPDVYEDVFPAGRGYPRYEQRTWMPRLRDRYAVMQAVEKAWSLFDVERAKEPETP